MVRVTNILLKSAILAFFKLAKFAAELLTARKIATMPLFCHHIHVMNPRLKVSILAFFKLAKFAAELLTAR